MASSIPHDAETPVSTPASESAQHTTGVRSSDSQSSPAIEITHDISSGNKHVPEFKSALDSGPSTPGANVPGAFPQDAQTGEPYGINSESVASKLGKNGHDSRNIAQDVIDKAREYIPGQENVRGAVQHAGETAAHYLPKSVFDTISPYLRKLISTFRSTALLT